MDNLNKKQYKNLFHEATEYKIPDDFNSFIDRVYEKVISKVRSRVKYAIGGVNYTYSNDRIESIVSKYIIHMLERDKHGIVRYKRYDAEKYPGVPYYSWFTMGLKFYMKDYWRDVKKVENRKKLVREETLKTLKIKVSKDKLGYLRNWNNINSSIFVKEIKKYLKKYSSGGKAIGFEPNVYKLYLLKLEGYSNVELAKYFNVNPSLISKWMKRLGSLILDYLSWAE